jgi:hypothetical protein
MSKVILGRPLHGSGWEEGVGVKKKDLGMVVTPVDVVSAAIVLVDGSEKLNGADARLVVVM